MRRLLVLVLLATAVVLGRPPALAGACSCEAASPAEYAEDADVVFSGAWIGEEHRFPEDDLDDAVDELIHTFAVERAYKGEVGAEVQVSSFRYSSECGAEFDEGRHLVYAHLDDRSGDLSTALCSGNEHLEDGDEVPAELGPGRVIAGATAPGDGAGQGASPVAGDAGAGLSSADDDASVADLLVALGAVGMGMAVVAGAVAWMVARRRDGTT